MYTICKKAPIIYVTIVVLKCSLLLHDAQVPVIIKCCIAEYMTADLCLCWSPCYVYIPFIMRCTIRQ